MQLKLKTNSNSFFVQKTINSNISNFKIQFEEIFSYNNKSSNHYCDNEVRKFISIHTSIARGGGKQVRYVPVYMIANPVTILNPLLYFSPESV